MSLHTYSLDEKIEIAERLIHRYRSGNASEREAADILKSIAADLRGRGEMPRSLALGEIERAIKSVKQSHTGLGYENGKLMALAERLIRHWPTVQQALEQFGEEVAQ